MEPSTEPSAGAWRLPWPCQGGLSPRLSRSAPKTRAQRVAAWNAPLLIRQGTSSTELVARLTPGAAQPHGIPGAPVPENLTSRLFLPALPAPSGGKPGLVSDWPAGLCSLRRIVDVPYHRGYALPQRRQLPRVGATRWSTCGSSNTRNLEDGAKRRFARDYSASAIMTGPAVAQARPSAGDAMQACARSSAQC